MDIATPLSLTDRIRAFLAKPNYATLATLSDDGTPHQTVIWFRLEPDDRILVNSRGGRRWPSELGRDSRCSLAVTDRDDPFLWVGLQTTVESVITDVVVARDDIIELAHRYGEDEASAARFRTQQRISFRLRILAAHDHLDG